MNKHLKVLLKRLSVAEKKLKNAEKEFQQTINESKLKVLKAKEERVKDEQQLNLLKNEFIGLNSISKLNVILTNSGIQSIDFKDFI